MFNFYFKFWKLFKNKNTGRLSVQIWIYNLAVVILGWVTLSICFDTIDSVFMFIGGEFRGIEKLYVDHVLYMYQRLYITLFTGWINNLTKLLYN